MIAVLKVTEIHTMSNVFNSCIIEHLINLTLLDVIVVAQYNVPENFHVDVHTILEDHR